MEQRYPTGMESLDLILLKHIFGSAAQRANPTVREFIKGCVRGDISVGIALFRIVNITADVTFPFFHPHLLSKSKLRYVPSSLRCLDYSHMPNNLPALHNNSITADGFGEQVGRAGCALRLFQYFIIIESFDVILVLALLLNQKGEEIPEVFILVLFV